MQVGFSGSADSLILLSWICLIQTFSTAKGNRKYIGDIAPCAPKILKCTRINDLGGLFFDKNKTLVEKL
jgi:hypothetical protein